MRIELRQARTAKSSPITRRQSALAVTLGALAATSIGACSFIETDDLTGGEPHAKDAAHGDDTAADGTIDTGTPPSADATLAVDAPVDAVTVDANLGDAANDADADTGVDAGPLSYVQMVLAERPLAYWRLGDTGLIAASEIDSAQAGGYSGNVTLGVPGAIDGDPNTAVHLGGTMGSIVMPDILAFDGHAPFTFELWARLPPVDGIYRRLFGREGFTPVYNYTLLYQMYSPGLVFGIQSPGANVNVPGAHELRPNVWNHIVVTYDGTSVSVYANGTISGIGLTTTAANDGGAATFRLGSDTYASSELNGDLDEVAVYGKALDAGTIAAHYAAAGPHDAGVDADAGDASDAGHDAGDAARDATAGH